MKTKLFKRILSLALAAMSVLTLSVGAFAAEAPDVANEPLAIVDVSDDHDHTAEIGINPAWNPLCKHTSYTLTKTNMGKEWCPSIVGGHTWYLWTYKCDGFLCDEGYTENYFNCTTCS